MQHFQLINNTFDDVMRNTEAEAGGERECFLLLFGWLVGFLVVVFFLTSKRVSTAEAVAEHSVPYVCVC